MIDGTQLQLQVKLSWVSARPEYQMHKNPFLTRSSTLAPPAPKPQKEYAVKIKSLHFIFIHLRATTTPCHFSFADLMRNFQRWTPMSLKSTSESGSETKQWVTLKPPVG